MIRFKKGGYGNIASSFFAIKTYPFMKKLIRILEGFTVKKFLLVVFIGIVLAIDLYGIVNEIMIDEVKEIDHISETTKTVYVE